MIGELSWKYFLKIIKFIEVILIRLHISSVQSCNISSVFYIVFTTQSQVHDVTIYLTPLPSSTLNTLIPSSTSPTPSFPLIPLSLLSVSVSFLFVHLSLSVLQPTYEWNHMVLVFFSLTYLLSMVFSNSTYVVVNGGVSSSLMAQ